MKNFKLTTLVLAIMASLLFVACDDKDDNKQETNTCVPASCAMAENATEMGCSDAGSCVVKACADKFKVADDAKSCVADEAPKCEGDAPACDPACTEGNDCICSDGAWTCVPVDVTDKCDPKCPEGKKCECTNDACACADIKPPVNECDGKAAGDECADGKTCQAEGEGLACKDKPADPIDPCADKSENDACGENKTCQKGEGDKLACKDAPAKDPE